jgi:hypothetical protein
MSDYTSAIAVEIAQDKDDTRRVLESVGLPVPEGATAGTLEDALGDRAGDRLPGAPEAAGRQPRAGDLRPARRRGRAAARLADRARVQPPRRGRALRGGPGPPGAGGERPGGRGRRADPRARRRRRPAQHPRADRGGEPRPAPRRRPRQGPHPPPARRADGGVPRHHRPHAGHRAGRRRARPAARHRQPLHRRHRGGPDRRDPPGQRHRLRDGGRHRGAGHRRDRRAHHRHLRPLPRERRGDHRGQRRAGAADAHAPQRGTPRDVGGPILDMLYPPGARPPSR